MAMEVPPMTAKQDRAIAKWRIATPAPAHLRLVAHPPNGEARARYEIQY
jgi:hypothetical protein